MSNIKNCPTCDGSGKDKLKKVCSCAKPASFDALHMVYHERDFRVRVNDPTVNFVERILAQEVGLEVKGTCPACRAGYDFFALQPNDDDRKR